MFRKFFTFILLVSLCYPFVISLRSIISGGLPFWYDPARDLFLGLDNIKKFTLIGPPSGIPGVFYGPYWVWLLSTSLLISKDPRMVAFISQTLPYLILFPIFLIKFKGVFNRYEGIILWLVFILAFEKYPIYLWNPHLAPLFYLILAVLLVRYALVKNIHSLGMLFVSGFICGLILNFHISFGLTIVIASSMYLAYILLVRLIKQRYKDMQQLFAQAAGLLSFSCGVMFSLTPFFIFEVRHGFNQTKAITDTLFKSVIQNSAVVGQIGLTKKQIVSSFFEVPSQLLQIPNLSLIPYFVLGCLIFYTLILVYQKKGIQFQETRLFVFILICGIVQLTVYLITKNPVWVYHFIGTEVVFLLLIGLLIRAFLPFKILLICLLIINLFKSYGNLINSSKVDPLSIPTFGTKKHIVEKIYTDIENEPFTVYAYSPAIYTFDFDYIFYWLGTEKYRIPEKDPMKTRVTYLIIPASPESVKIDFINYRTPDKDYKTSQVWKIADGTTILKRVKKI